MVYSFFYIAPYFKSVYFLWATFLFVVSIVLVVNMSSLFYVILGWDGLGMVSFFLIVYYQNSSSIFSGVFTLLINRLGDSFFLIRLSIILIFSPDFFVFYSLDGLDSFIGLFLIITFITKRALYPFSS